MEDSPDKFTSQTGRPRKDFDDLSERSKRRRFLEEDELWMTGTAHPALPASASASSSTPSDVADQKNKQCEVLFASVSDDEFFDVRETITSDDYVTTDSLGNRDSEGNGEGNIDRGVKGIAEDSSVEGIPEDRSVVVIPEDSNVQGILEDVSDDSECFYFSDVGNLYFDCDFCINCHCVTCDICAHSEDGQCSHCDSCIRDSISVASDSDNDSSYEASKDDSREEDLVVLSEEDIKNSEMRNDLAEICLKHKASHALLSDILGFMRKHSVGNFPKCPKTLLKTPVVSVLRDVTPGQYWHHGITSHIIKYVQKSGVSIVNVTISSDGVPVFNSSAISFWPLTCSFNSSPEVHLIGVYLGSEKPADPNDYLKDFVEEVSPLCLNGLNVDGKVISVSVVCAIFDAPAKSFVLCTKSFNAYYGCSKCHAEGEMLNRRMCYSELEAVLKTDDSFVKHTQEEYHKGRTNLENIPHFGCVSCVPLDYMHLLLLGLMRKLLYMWISGPLSVRLSSKKITNISQALVHLVGWVPCEFARKPRSLQYVKRFKATEFRQILLYTGPVILFKILPRRLYEHFCVFHILTTVYVDPFYCKEYLSYANELSVYFVKVFEELYGMEFVSHNVHSLIHLGADVEKFGPLDRFSSFKFENFYQILKKLVREGEKALQQLVHRYCKMEAFGFESSGSKSQGHASKQSKPKQFSGHHCSGPLVNECINPQYRSCTLESGLIITLSQANNCCVVEDTVVLVENFATSKKGGTVVIGRKFRKTENVFKFPCESSKFGILYAFNPSELQVWPAESITKKCFRMPWKNGYAVFPIHHNEQL